MKFIFWPVLAFALFMPSEMHAYPSVLFESEPNDTPEQAQTFRGEARLLGSAQSGDVDYFRWVLDDRESDRFWTLELVAPGESDVSLKALWPADEPETGVMEFGVEATGSDEFELLTMTTDARNRTVRRKNLIVPPGEHLLEFSAIGQGGDYQLLLTPGARFGLTATIEADTTREYQVNTAQDWNFQINVDEHRVELDADSAAGQRYSLEVIGELGTELEVAILDGGGNPIREALSRSPLAQTWHGVELPAGSLLSITRPDGEWIGRVGIRLTETGVKPEVALAPEPEMEVGTSMANAIWIEPEQPFESEFEPGQRRFLALEIPDDDSTAWDLSVKSDQDDEITVCLIRMGLRTNQDRICRPSGDGRVFAAMQPAPRDYALQLDRGRPRGVEDAARVEVTLTPVVPQSLGHAREPNDGRDWAATMRPEQRVTGHLASSRSAWFKLAIDETDAIWQVVAQGDNLARLRFYRFKEERWLHETTAGYAGGANAPLVLDYLPLSPGRYLVELQGDATDFHLTAERMQEVDFDLAIEPNNNRAQSNSLRLGRTLRGRFVDTRDRDWFHFHQPGWNRMELELEPPESGNLNAWVYWDDEERYRFDGIDEPICASVWLPPGDQYISLWTGQFSPNPYHLTLQISDPWSSCGPATPATTPKQAQLLPADGELKWGMGLDEANEGYFYLPIAAEDRRLDIEANMTQAELVFQDASGNTIELLETDEDHRYQMDIPALEPVLLHYVRRHFRFPVQIDDPAATDQWPEEVRVELSADIDSVPPYWPEAQSISTTLTLTGTELAGRELALEAHASHEGWSVDGLPETITLEPGETRQFELTWHLPHDLPESVPVGLFVRVGFNTAILELALNPDAPPASSIPAPELPGHLAGLTNLAWNALGADFVDAETGEVLEAFPDQTGYYQEFLIDGLSTAGSHIDWRGEMGEPLPPLKLADDGGAIHALVFNQRSGLAPHQRWRKVEFSLGNTPGQLEVMGTIELRAGDGLQVFELDQPVEARYLGLRPISIWAESVVWTSGTGMLAVLGKPGGDRAETRHDLMLTELGGYWVYSRPDERAFDSFPPDRPRRLAIRGRSVELVYAFLNHRAARLDRLEWIDQSGSDDQALQMIRVYTSTESAVGPWELQGEWAMDPAPGAVSRFEFADQAWARYLKLAFDEPERRPGVGAYWRFPESIHAYERGVLSERQSILGFWGMDGQEGPFERTLPKASRIVQVDDADSSSTSPRALQDRVTGVVHEPLESRHYRLRMNAPDNTFQFELQESMPGRLQVELADAHGDAVGLSWTEHAGGRTASVVGLAPGDYALVITEPPRSFTFIWDGSGSLAAHQPAIYQAINRFSQGLQPAQEVANLMPLGGPLLLREWASSPVEVQAALNVYDQRFDSSDSEPALQIASRAMEQLPGESVIFLITDAQVNRRLMAAWDDLERVRPRVFGLEINHGSRSTTTAHRWYQHLMKSWVNVGGGRYSYSSGRTDLIRNFEAAMREVRQPTTFALSVESSYQEPPAPGTLSVVSGAVPSVAGGVVHLIFDASGSMLRRMEGGRRIDVARRIVREIIDARIPESVPIALRAYGHTEPHSCETELLVAPTPGNHGAVQAAVEGIRAINLARTPLAASLDAVLDDLDGFEDQTRLVVMLTDGEETCDGDVEAAVQRLIDEGINVRLNIVGFHIDELGLQTEFERFAELGGGEYFDSQDGEELIEGMTQALAADFRVYDAAGNPVARGRVDGEAVTLEPGRYELEIESDRGTSSQDIVIEPQGNLEIEVDISD